MVDNYPSQQLCAKIADFCTKCQLFYWNHWTCGARWCERKSKPVFELAWNPNHTCVRRKTHAQTILSLVRAAVAQTWRAGAQENGQLPKTFKHLVRGAVLLVAAASRRWSLIDQFYIQTAIGRFYDEYSMVARKKSKIMWVFLRATLRILTLCCWFGEEIILVPI